MEVYEHKQQFRVKYCDVDFKDELKPSIALALMEEVACYSADELGFGYAFVKPRGYAFMVTNVHMRFFRPVRLGERVCVKTWPTPPTRVIFGREYQFQDEEGKEVIDATSRWCLIDMQAEKILPSKAVDNQDYSTYNTKKLFDEVAWKLPAFKQKEGELRFTLTIANSEYDHNFHVNNTKYADYCFNCFSVEELRNKRLKEFSISYIKQCKEGETLYFYRKPTQNGGWLAHGFNGLGEPVVQSYIVFEEEE